MFGIGITRLIVILFIVSISGLISILPFWRIFTKAGFPEEFSLLMFIPIANIIILFFLAFAEWPALQKENSRI